jgi:predicted glycoside hydrolase/deacetylase ChbG (UPF0249 family)
VRVVRRLVVTADDVGLHPAITDAAVHAFRSGIVTACSVVAGGPSFEHAVATLCGAPELAVGVHLTLVGEVPLAPPARVRSLLGSDGRLHGGHAALFRRFVAGRIELAEIELELRAQIERVLGQGITVSHLNSHQHVHVLPGIIDIVARLAGEYRIGFVRLPVDRWPAGSVGPVRTLAVRTLRWFAERARLRLAAVATPTRTIGVAAAGHLDVARLHALVPLIGEGVTELVCHPGLDDASLGRAYPWGYCWEQETAALCDTGVKELMKQAGVQLVPPTQAITG